MALEQVNSGTLASKRDEVANLNRQLASLKEGFVSVEGNLNSKWEGETKNAFHTTFTQDMEKVQAFINGVEQYLNALTQIIQTHETTEATNTQIASSR